MAVVVRVPTQLRSLTGGSNRVEVEAGTVGDVVNALETAHPGFAERLLDDKGAVRRYVNLFVDDEDIRFAQGLATQVKDGQTISVVPAVAGG
ncbi:MAG TPA: ubiquitin-like small modifier protein 1 [Acidimicrobiales bacterium]|nr:ubiquitin-like small modifier protein 1 [Acidimicrobiales bacterium]